MNVVDSHNEKPDKGEAIIATFPYHHTVLRWTYGAGYSAAISCPEKKLDFLKFKTEVGMWA